MNETTSSLPLPPEILKVRSELSNRAFAATVLLGVLGSALFKGATPGINVTLWIVSVVASLWCIEAFTGNVVQSKQRWLFLPLLILSVCFVWRDSRVLMNLDFGFAIFLTFLIPWEARGKELLRNYFQTYMVRVSRSFERIFVGFSELVCKDMEWKSSHRSKWTRHLPQVLTGLVIALPLVLLFGGLFYSADIRFENFVGDLFDFDVQDAFLYFCIWLLCAWLAGGLFRATLLSEMRSDEEFLNQRSYLGMIETNVVLLVLNVLFATFVIIQVPYLFGGAERIERIPELTFSAYARRGFFELVGVASLLLPLLLIADWLVGAEMPKKFFRLFSGTLVGLMFIIMASAVQRMWLYQSTYGLTELRFYTTAFMFWLACVFVWYQVTVLRGRRNYFCSGSLAIAFVFLLALHGVNPDRVIASTNLERAREGMPFDSAYTASLSADAIPVMVENRDVGSVDDRIILRGQIDQFMEQQDSNDWRSWNFSRSKAQKEINNHE